MYAHKTFLILFIGTKMRLISVVICGLFYSALANDDMQPKSIFFVVVAVIHLLKLLFSFIDIGIFNVVRFPNAACVGSNANVSISFI